MSSVRKLLLATALLSAVALGSFLSAYVEAKTPPDPREDRGRLERFWREAQPEQPGRVKLPKGMNGRVLAKAQPDECFAGVGKPSPEMVDGKCPTGSVPKVNEAYVWGLAKSGNDLWFGTAPNVHCLVMSGYLGMTEANQTDSWVCEFGKSASGTGDWRPPSIYAYDIEKRSLAEKTDDVINRSTADKARFNSTTGIRSAGALGKVVFLGGPGFAGGINIFAFNSRSGEYIGSTTLTQYSNIRKWLVVDDVLYLGVGSRAGGNVLRWTGDAADPFKFDVVGNVAGDAAELAFHEGRIFVSTWPAGGSIAGLYMSPRITAKGLPPVTPDAPKWEKVWDAAMYDPDPITAATYGGGALASFDGYLYWGTMHVPFVAAEAHFGGGLVPDSQEKLLAAVLGTHRSISIFRGRGFGTSKEKTEVVYGMPSLPVVKTDGTVTVEPTKMGPPLRGPSGFGNFFNNYSWTMSVWDDQLFVGTMDWSYLAYDMLKEFTQHQTGSPLTATVELPSATLGADLFAFPDSRSAAFAVSTDGVGNYSSYGIRNMLSTEDFLYLGMANPMNLLTDKSDDKPEGGWELIRISD